jgi:hypothetical protein
MVYFYREVEREKVRFIAVIPKQKWYIVEFGIVIEINFENCSL